LAFSGGGISKITPHVHDNLAGEGGALSNLTLLNSNTLVSSFVSSDHEAWLVLDEHTVSNLDTSYTFTPTTPIEWSDYDVIQIVTGLTSNGSNDLRFRANTAEGQSYQFAGRDILANATETIIGLTAQTHFLCGDQGRVARAATQVIELREMATNKMSIMCNSVLQDVNSTALGNFNNYGWNAMEIDDTIVNLELSCSASSWASGTIRILGRVKKSA
tara:strand:+ start:790 stop:1440 length:651 start_codon:yes stop_codon:yes gene_type:complete